MSWQGNECFVFGIDYVSDHFHEQVVENMSELLYLYGEHGNGWYLLGNMGGNEEEEDYDPFEPTSYYGSAPSCICWMPNPFMGPAVIAMLIRNPHDLLEAAFECWDCSCDVIAYAGNGNEPLERMEVYGEVYDMRAA